MAVKKSELYSSIWSSCDTLRGSMDASQYKDYVLVLLFIKYISDKYAGKDYQPINVPKGASFQDMVALKGKSDIGDQINKKIIAPLIKENDQLSQADFPDFNDPTKLGDDKEKVDRLTKLISIFERKEFNFSKNRADGDDILGDAYEYLMCNFAVQSGKSKGQFYTPAEVSRTIAQVLGIRYAETTRQTTVYDPTCGSGSLLLRVADEAKTKVTLNGQERDATTCGLARMNMILHDNAEAFIAQGNTLAAPKFKDKKGELQTFDYVVANPPFSDKEWSSGITPETDPYDRFNAFGIPPNKQGDYAYLLHIVRSLKSTGRGACILPHGVLFRGNSEAEIRRNLIRKGYIKGIIGLPANLFFGTGIPACIVVLDKKEAHSRKGIFMIDASAGYMKEGPKNRLRARDIHKMVDAFTKMTEIPKFSRMVSLDEIEKNDFNLNIPRYIDSQQEEDIQDIDGHLNGGIPLRDVEALQQYWDVCPNLRKTLFKSLRKGYVALAVDKVAIKPTIYEHKEFAIFIHEMNEHFAVWRKKQAKKLRELGPDMHPKEVVKKMSEDILAHYEGKPLIDKYAVYQHVMDYWDTTMQDDCYLIAADGWKAETYRVTEVKEGKNGKPDKIIDKGWACDLVPKDLIVQAYFSEDQEAIKEMTAKIESSTARMAEIEEENSGEEGFFSDFDKVNKANVAARVREIKDDKTAKEELNLLNEWLKLAETEADLKKQIIAAESALDAKAMAKYPKLNESEVKALVIDHKWLATLDVTIHGELDRISQSLTERVRELAERYESTMLELNTKAKAFESKVNAHLKKVEFAKLTAQKQSIKQGAAQKQSKLKGNWIEKRLGDSAVLKARIGWQGLTTAEYLDSGDYYLVTGTEFENGYINWPKCHYVEASRYSQDKNIQLKLNDVLVTKDGTIGKVALVNRLDKPATLNSGVFVIRPLNGAFDPLFFYHLLCSHQFDAFLNQLCAGSTINHLYQKDFVTFIYKTPPTLSEQTAIATILSDMDAEIDILEQKLTKARQVKQGIMQELLTGKTRLT